MKNSAPYLTTQEKISLKVIIELIEKWFSLNRREFPWRDRTSTEYEKIITEILVQRTKAETVSSIYSSFFRKFPSWDTLAAASLEEIQIQIRALGIWRRRSITLNKLAREMVGRNGVFPSLRKDIDALPGVGQYVGNAIEMFVHQRAMPLIDTNMARVMERVFRPRNLADIRYDPWLQEVCTKVVQTDNPAETNWAILDLGGTICRPKNPVCGECPLSDHCNYFKAKA